MPKSDRPRILLVDDDPLVLEALQRQLRSRYDVTIARGSKEAMRLVVSEGPFAVVVSDLRMPEMDGVSFLFCLRKTAPEAVRVLLTGDADVEAAVSAVNLGNVFRFLTKPCPTWMLLRVLENSVEEHRRITSERRLHKPETEKGQHDVREDTPC